MWVRRIIAWAMLSLALFMLGPEVVQALDVGHYYPLTLMNFWQHFAPGSLGIVRMVENSPLFFWGWDPVLTTFLNIPGWGLPLIFSLYFFNVSRQAAAKPLLQ